MSSSSRPDETDTDTAPLLFVLCVDIDPKHDEAFNDWYDNEHLPAVVACPGVISGRRYTARRVSRRDDEPVRYWAVYEVESEEAMTSPEITALAADGFGRFADDVRNARRFWFEALAPAV